MKPPPPLFSHPPLRIAADTWLVRHVHDAAGSTLPVGSLVVRGAEPAIVDTGAACNRDQWFRDVFGLVDPGDVRWVFLSHDHADHDGNLEPLLDACPRATLVVGRALAARLALRLALPAERCLLAEDGDAFDAGDRRFLAVRPPVYDSATTRGLLDTRTGVYWAVDAWGAATADAVADAADLDPARWRTALLAFARATAPWLADLDPVRWRAAVDAVAALRPAVIAPAHGPVISGPRVADAVDVLRDAAGRVTRAPAG